MVAIRFQATSRRLLSTSITRAAHPGLVNYQGGRSSVSGLTVAVFGGGGFLGRYVIQTLGPIGSRVIIPYRGDDYDIKHLKVMGDLGQIYPFNMKLRDVDAIEKAVSECNVVINLLGKNFETMAYSVHDVHVRAPKLIAKISAACGVERLLHVSCLGADVNSACHHLRTKALGEYAVRDAFPDATIFRTGTLVGHEDKFFNKWAYGAMATPYIPVVNKGITKLQPVMVADVAKAMFASLKDETHTGKTYELAGPEVYTIKDLMDYMYATTRLPNNAINVPSVLANVLGSIVEKMPNPSFTKDQFVKATIDQVKSDDSPGFEAFGITPTDVKKGALPFLQMYRPQSGFGSDDMPVKMPGS